MASPLHRTGPRPAVEAVSEPSVVPSVPSEGSGYSGSGDPVPPSADAGAVKIDFPRKHKRALVEFCCMDASLLGHHAADDTFVVRCTQAEDMTTAGGAVCCRLGCSPWPSDGGLAVVLHSVYGWEHSE